MNAAGDEQAGVASGINNAASRVAGLLAIAVLGVVMISVFSGTLEEQLAAVSAPLEAKQAVFEARADLAATPVPESVQGHDRTALRAAIDASFVRGFRWVAGISAVLALLSAGTAAWMIDPAGDTTS